MRNSIPLIRKRIRLYHLPRAPAGNKRGHDGTHLVYEAILSIDILSILVFRPLASNGPSSSCLAALAQVFSSGLDTQHVVKP